MAPDVNSVEYWFERIRSKNTAVNDREYWDARSKQSPHDVNDRDYWEERCRKHDYARFTTKEDIARFRAAYMAEMLSYKDENGKQIFDEEYVRADTEAYDDDEIAMYIHTGNTPESLADIMSM